MKVALVYDRINTWGGAERVLLVLHELFPEAPLFTSVYDEQNAQWASVFPNIYTSFLQKIPFAKKHHEFFGWLMPLAFEQFNFDNYNLVISVTSEAAKGIIAKPQTLHFCYCLTPTRYLWSGYAFYFRNSLLKSIAKPLIKYLRLWDQIAVQRPDVMVGISKIVVDRIKKYYGREVGVVYPPIEQFKIQSSKLKVSTQNSKVGNYFLIVSRLVPYKRIDVAIQAFNKLGLTLVIVGTGRDEKRLKQISGSNIIFVGELTDRQLAQYYSRATALIFPQEEDFGMVAVEAQLMGIPVIAYKKGGAVETIINEETGIFFASQTPNAIIDAVKQFQTKQFKPSIIRKHAQRFSKERFKKEFLKFIKAHTS